MRPGTHYDTHSVCRTERRSEAGKRLVSDLRKKNIIFLNNYHFTLRDSIPTSDSALEPHGPDLARFFWINLKFSFLVNRWRQTHVICDFGLSFQTSREIGKSLKSAIVDRVFQTTVLGAQRHDSVHPGCFRELETPSFTMLTTKISHCGRQTSTWLKAMVQN